MKQDKIIYWVGIHTIALTNIFIIILGYWTFYPYTPIVFNETPFKVLNENKQVRQGEALIYLSTSCRNFTGEVEVHRSLVDHSLISFPGTIFYQEKKGCADIKNATLTIPTYAPEGKYYLKITSFVKVNPIRRVAVVVNTEEFEVTSNKVDKEKVE